MSTITLRFESKWNFFRNWEEWKSHFKKGWRGGYSGWTDRVHRVSLGMGGGVSPAARADYQWRRGGEAQRWRRPTRSERRARPASAAVARPPRRRERATPPEDKFGTNGNWQRWAPVINVRRANRGPQRTLSMLSGIQMHFKCKLAPNYSLPALIRQCGTISSQKKYRKHYFC